VKLRIQGKPKYCLSSTGERSWIFAKPARRIKTEKESPQEKNRKADRDKPVKSDEEMQSSNENLKKERAPTHAF
jgi:hypothetical protein